MTIGTPSSVVISTIMSQINFLALVLQIFQYFWRGRGEKIVFNICARVLFLLPFKRVKDKVYEQNSDCTSFYLDFLCQIYIKRISKNQKKCKQHQTLIKNRGCVSINLMKCLNDISKIRSNHFFSSEQLKDMEANHFQQDENAIVTNTQS